VLKRIATVLGLALAMLIAAAGVMYLAGLRVVLDGGGTPTLRFIRSADDQADAIARHREAQRQAGSPAPQSSTAATPPPPTPDASKAPTTDAGATAPPSTMNAPYWTDFRGPARDGHYRQREIRTDWPATGLKPLWKEPVGGGYASFVAANGTAFTIEQRGAKEIVAAYEIATGRELWTHGWDALFREMMGGDGPRATPTWHDGRLYALGATGELRCLDAATGKLLWRTDILHDAGASNLQWGMAAAPLIVDDNVIVTPGGQGGKSVVAYNRLTGRQAWSALNDAAAYSSPMLVTLGGIRQILVFSASRLMGITPSRGDLLWEYPWTTQYGVNASQPLLLDDRRVFVSTGYGAGAAAIELTPAADGRLSVKELWRTNRMKNQFTSSVLHDGFIYGLDEAILACLDAATGELKWKGGRYGYGQVALASGHLVVLTEGGELALVRATPQNHQEITRFPAIEGKTWNHPAFSDGFLLVRNLNEMAAFDLRR
jgi:outer membrane protein assembly factor BamB